MYEAFEYKKNSNKHNLVIETKELLDCLLEENLTLINMLVKKLILAWDPDYTKVSFEEAEKLKATEQEMKAGMYY